MPPHHGEVALRHAPAGEVGGQGGGSGCVEREEHRPGGRFVEAMDGEDMPAEATAQPAHQDAGFARVELGRMDQPAGGLENGDEPFVLMQERRLVALGRRWVQSVRRRNCAPRTPS